VVGQEPQVPDVRSLVDQLNAAFDTIPSCQHLSVQRHVVDSFLGLTAVSERQRTIFEAIMGCLIERIDRRALLELSRRLASVDTVPAEIIGRLARHHDFMIAAPVLEASEVLTDESLVMIAKEKSHNHLYAIAGRKRINEIVTEALVARGHLNVLRRAVENTGANFSGSGFAKVVQIARYHKALASALAVRKDLPVELRPFLRIACAEGAAK
jgi:uncharacterized protein (DUF2336 family)